MFAYMFVSVSCVCLKRSLDNPELELEKVLCSSIKEFHDSPEWSRTKFIHFRKISQ